MTVTCAMPMSSYSASLLKLVFCGITVQDRLLKTFGLSSWIRATKLLNMDDLGDHTPSAIMNKMLSLLDGHQQCMLFQQLFLNHMPDPIRLQLADENLTDPRKVAEQADQLWLSMKQNGSSTFHKVAYPCCQAKVKPTAPMKHADTNPD